MAKYKCPKCGYILDRPRIKTEWIYSYCQQGGETKEKCYKILNFKSEILNLKSEIDNRKS